MKGLQGMMASMLGMTSDEIDGAINEVKTALFAMADGMKKIHAQNVEIRAELLEQRELIISQLERLENVGSKRKPGSGSGSSDGGSAG